MVLSMYCNISEDLLIGVLFYLNESRPQLIGYADAYFLSDKGISQICYLFTSGGTTYHGAQHNKLYLPLHQIMQRY